MGISGIQKAVESYSRALADKCHAQLDQMQENVLWYLQSHHTLQNVNSTQYYNALAANFDLAVKIHGRPKDKRAYWLSNVRANLRAAHGQATKEFEGILELDDIVGDAGNILNLALGTCGFELPTLVGGECGKITQAEFVKFGNANYSLFAAYLGRWTDYATLAWTELRLSGQIDYTEQKMILAKCIKHYEYSLLLAARQTATVMDAIPRNLAFAQINMAELLPQDKKKQLLLVAQRNLLALEERKHDPTIVQKLSELRETYGYLLGS
jgi:hypothetical protein